MIIRSTLFIVFFFFLVGCGFKSVDQDYFKGYDIVANIKGDNRISYLLSNSLKKKSANSLDKILIDAKVKKNKNIKEKNIKNVITKYEINISILITFRLLNENKAGSFKIEKKGFYEVNDKHSITLNNEKKLIKSLVEQISKQILNDLPLMVNDI